jgi:hypothetical protein
MQVFSSPMLNQSNDGTFLLQCNPTHVLSISLRNVYIVVDRRAELICRSQLFWNAPKGPGVGEQIAKRDWRPLCLTPKGLLKVKIHMKTTSLGDLPSPRAYPLVPRQKDI